MESEDSSLTDEIARVRNEIESIMAQVREDRDALVLLREKILTLMNVDPEYARNPDFNRQINKETQLTNDYVDKIKKLTKLRVQYTELEKKHFSK